MATRDVQGILGDENREARDQIVELLKQAYFAELETVINYMTNSTNPDGLRAMEVKKSLQKDIAEELGHAGLFAARIKDLYGVVPSSVDFVAQQTSLKPPADQLDLVHVIKGVIEAETSAIELFNKIIDVTEEVDPVTNDMVIAILADEEGHRRLFEGFLREAERDGLVGS